MIETSNPQMNQPAQSLAEALFSELLTIDQLARHRLAQVLPKGMELSHFNVLNHLAHAGEEKSPGQLAATFHLTRGAMTNTLTKLEWAGWVHIRPDWDDARRKKVAISPAGIAARDAAIAAIAPVIADALGSVEDEKVRATLPVLRALRQNLIRG